MGWSLFGTDHLKTQSKEFHVTDEDMKTDEELRIPTFQVCAGNMTSQHLGNIVEFHWVDPNADGIQCEVLGLLNEVTHQSPNFTSLGLRASARGAALRQFRLRSNDIVTVQGA